MRVIKLMATVGKKKTKQKQTTNHISLKRNIHIYYKTSTNITQDQN